MSLISNDNSKYVLKLQTIQANEFRILIEALKDILNGY